MSEAVIAYDVLGDAMLLPCAGWRRKVRSPND